MDIEQLRLILDTIKSLGETAGWATVAVFGVPYLINLLQSIAWVGGILGLALAGKAAYQAHLHAKQRVTEAAKQLDPNEAEKTKQAQLALETAQVKRSDNGAMRDLYALCCEVGIQPSGVYWINSVDFDQAMKRARTLNNLAQKKEAA